MLKIWGRANSSNVQKVVWCCGELGLDYERVDAGMQFGVNDTAEYRAMNPNGLVPTINDDGFVLWESHAIVRYLARKSQPATLWPVDARAAADADRWMDWYHTVLWPRLGLVFRNLIRTPPEKRDMALVEDHRRNVAAALAMVESRLAASDYIAGNHFSVGDIPLGIAAYRWFNLPLERPELPALARWYRSICERPAYRRHCMLPLT